MDGAAKVQRIEYGTYLVPSASREGLTHVVTAKGTEYECDCEAGALGFACWHAAAVLIAKVERMTGARVKGPAPVAPKAEAPKVRETPRRQALV